MTPETKFDSVVATLDFAFLSKSASNDDFVQEVQQAIEAVLVEPFVFCADECAKILNEFGYSLKREMPDERGLTVRYSRHALENVAERPVFCLTFDLNVSSCRARETIDGFENSVDECYPANDIDKRFSWSALEKLSTESRLEKLKELQDVLEACHCSRMRKWLEIVINHFNKQGGDFHNLRSASPEIDFQDLVSGLRVGIYSIVTVHEREEESM